MATHQSSAKIEVFKGPGSQEPDKAVIHTSNGKTVGFDLRQENNEIEVLFMRYAVEHYCELNGVLKNLASGQVSNSEQIQAEVMVKVLMDGKTIGRLAVDDVCAIAAMVLTSLQQPAMTISQSNISACIDFVTRAQLKWNELAPNGKIEFPLSECATRASK